MLPPQILIVDADASARAALRTLLDEHAGLPVAAECGTLGEARQLLVRRTIHLVFLELDLPGEDGLALLPCIPPTARVVLLTAPERGLVRELPGRSREPSAQTRHRRSVGRGAPPRLPRAERAAAGGYPDMNETFQEKFCRHFSVPADRYAATLQSRTLYPAARALGWLLVLFDRRYFEPDRDFVAHVGRLTRRRDFAIEAEAFRQDPVNHGFLRGTLRLRISVARVQLQFFEMWDDPAEESLGETITRLTRGR